MLLLMAPKAELPEGLAFHCDRCRVVIPEDAPRPDIAGDIEVRCEEIARHKLAWFNPRASARHQHIMACAAWHMVYWHALRSETPHAESAAYLKRFKLQPELHWRTSRIAQS